MWIFSSHAGFFIFQLLYTDCSREFSHRELKLKKKSCISIHSDYLLELDYLGRNHVISCTHYGLSYVKKTIYIYSVVIINVCVESFSLLHNFMAFIDMLLLFLFRSLIRFNDFSAFIIKLVITIYRIEICQWIN